MPAPPDPTAIVWAIALIAIACNLYVGIGIGLLIQRHRDGKRIRELEARVATWIRLYDKLDSGEDDYDDDADDEWLMTNGGFVDETLMRDRSGTE